MSNQQGRVTILTQSPNAADALQEIPLTALVAGDFGGQSSAPSVTQPLEERKPVDVTYDTLDKVVASFQPKLEFSVPNTLSEDGTVLPVSLDFKKMSDFDAGAVALQIPALQQLIAARNMLFEAKAKPALAKQLRSAIAKVQSQHEKPETQE